MRNLLAIGVAATCTCVVALADTTCTSASYVQDGLIAQWDGIDNVGTGTHDPTATTWKDLKGSLDMALTAKGWWNSHGNALFVNGMGAQGTNAAPAYKTIEVVYRMTKNGGRLLFVSGLKSRIVAFDPATGIPKKIYFNGDGATHKRIDWSLDTEAISSVAATYSDDDVANTYLNGAARNNGVNGNTWGTGDGKVAVGNRNSSDTSYNWTGEVYAIRLYDKVLTDEEIAANHAIDQERFMLAEQMPTSADYVQDGLLVQWDGIDNAGTGTHDPTATTWKNLKGGGYDLTLTNNAAWNAEGRALVVDGISATYPVAAPEYKTIEVVFKRTNKGGNGRIMFNGGRNTQFVLFDGAENISVYFVGNTTTDGSVKTKRIYQEFIPSEINFLAAQFDDNGVVTDVFKDADVREDGLHANPWFNSPNILIGGRIMSGNAEYLWYGEVYAIRLYGTRLTKAQLAHNHRIDRQRFLTTSSYVQEGLSAHWDGIDNAGYGLHNSSASTWKNLVPTGQDLTIATGLWTDRSLMGVGNSAAATGTVQQTFATLETVFRNVKHDTSSVLFNGGLHDQFLALTAGYAQWTSEKGSSNFNRTVEGIHSLAGVVSGSGAAYIDGSPAKYEYNNDFWDPGLSYVQVGARLHSSWGSYPFFGDVFAIRTYSSALSAAKAAYNFKVDRQRFGLAPRSFIWNNVQDESLASGFFGTNGNWKVVENTNSVPGMSDAAVLPAGDYTVMLGDETVLESLSVGAGAKLKMTLPFGADVTNTVPLTVLGAVAADAGAGLVLDAQAFGKKHPQESITLIECEKDSSAALSTLAANISFDDTSRQGSLAVVDGVRLVYTAPQKSGMTIVVQ